MLDTSARLLRLLSLLQLRPDWSGAALADRLEITERTLRRDVRRLRELGYPVHAWPGVAGGYRLGAGASLPPLLLDDEEAVAVVVSLRTARHTISGIAETSLQALAKLEQVLPPRLRQRSAALQYATVPLAGTGPTVEPAALATIADACRSRRRLVFDYRDRTGTGSRREVEPHRMVHTGRSWYLVARDLDRDGWRSFRVDRIGDPIVTGVRFVPADPPDAAAFVAAAIAVAPYRHRARVLVHAPAEAVGAMVSPTAALVEAVDEGSCLLTTGSDSLDSIAVHLALLDAELTVLEPPELRERMVTMADRLRRATAEPTDRPRRATAEPAGGPDAG